MLSLNTCLRPNVGEVAAKIMDGEAIMINLSDGMYYSLDLAGGLVWHLIETGHSLEGIVNAVCAKYDVDHLNAEADIRRLVEELLEARLIQVSSEPCLNDSGQPQESAAPPVTYESPRLNAYHDMAELLALDPPHPWLSDTLSKPLTKA